MRVLSIVISTLALTLWLASRRMLPGVVLAFQSPVSPVTPAAPPVAPALNPATSSFPIGWGIAVLMVVLAVVVGVILVRRGSSARP